MKQLALDDNFILTRQSLNRAKQDGLNIAAALIDDVLSHWSPTWIWVSFQCFDYRLSPVC